MDAIKVFEEGSMERKKLQLAADMLALDGKTYKVDETYFDYGQGWVWTTILRDDGTWGWVQVLCPRQQEMIVNAETAEEVLAGVTWEYKGV